MDIINTGEFTRAPAYRFPAGARVLVRNEDGTVQPGRVAYVRLAPPDFIEPRSVSVALTSKLGVPGYTGTIFPADRVELA